MSYDAEKLRRACLQLENSLRSVEYKATMKDFPGIRYSSKLRESCRKHFSESIPKQKPPSQMYQQSMDNESCSTSSIRYNTESPPTSSGKRHKKFVLAKLELLRLHDLNKNCSNHFIRQDDEYYSSPSSLDLFDNTEVSCNDSCTSPIESSSTLTPINTTTHTLSMLNPPSNTDYLYLKASAVNTTPATTISANHASLTAFKTPTHSYPQYQQGKSTNKVYVSKKSNLKSKTKTNTETTLVSGKKVKMCPLAVFWDSALEGDIDTLREVRRDIQNPDCCNSNGITAIHNAVCSGSQECVDFLIQSGCEVNVMDDNGWTPLHYAALYGDYALCKFLVQHGANVYVKTAIEQQTPLDVCIARGLAKSKCALYLKKTESSLGVRNNAKVYATHDYSPNFPDELPLKKGDSLQILTIQDSIEVDWWQARSKRGRGYVPRTLLSVSSS